MDCTLQAGVFAIKRALLSYWFKHILLARTVDIIKQMLTVLKLQGLEWKQHAYIIPFLITNNIL